MVCCIKSCIWSWIFCKSILIKATLKRQFFHSFALVFIQVHPPWGGVFSFLAQLWLLAASYNVVSTQKPHSRKTADVTRDKPPTVWGLQKPFEPSHDKKDMMGEKKWHQQVVKWLADFSGSAPASLPGVLLADGDVFLHVVGGAHGHGRPLVDALRLDVQDVLVARGGHATSLLNDVSHGVALIQQPQLQEMKGVS